MLAQIFQWGQFLSEPLVPIIATESLDWNWMKSKQQAQEEISRNGFVLSKIDCLQLGICRKWDSFLLETLMCCQVYKPQGAYTNC